MCGSAGGWERREGLGNESASRMASKRQMKVRVWAAYQGTRYLLCLTLAFDSWIRWTLSPHCCRFHSPLGVRRGEFTNTPSPTPFSIKELRAACAAGRQGRQENYSKWF